MMKNKASKERTRKKIKQEKHKLSKRNAEFNIMFVWILLIEQVENCEKLHAIQCADTQWANERAHAHRIASHRSQDHYYGLIELVSAQ